MRSELLSGRCQSCRRIANLTEEWCCGSPLGYHSAVGGCVSPGEFGYLLACTVDVDPLGDVSAIREHYLGGGIGWDVFQPIFGQGQLLIAPDGAFHEDGVGS